MQYSKFFFHLLNKNVKNIVYERITYTTQTPGVGNQPEADRQPYQGTSLRQLFWECTLRCNLHCRHCGSDCKKIAGYQDMPKEDFLRVLDNVAAHTDPHKVFVILTGGEPLVREDLEECGRAIYEKGFPWGMVTNGLFLTPERLESLIRAGMHSATVSLDGFKGRAQLDARTSGKLRPCHQSHPYAGSLTRLRVRCSDPA